MALILLGTTKSNAALQANPTTHKSPVTKAGATWITQIRQMETTGQTMGLDETLDGLNATEENGIDVHMMLPTEYGAVAILSASGYGNPGKLRDETDAQKRTTTGNPTGVYFTGDRGELISNSTTGTKSKYLNVSNSIDSAFYGSLGFHSGSSTRSHYSIKVQGSVYLNDYCNAFAVGLSGIFSRDEIRSGKYLDNYWTNAWTGGHR